MYAQEPNARGQTPASVYDEQAGFQIGVGGLFGLPFGSLGDVVGWTGGVGFEVAYRLRRAPLLLGFEGQIQQYSTVSTTGAVTNVDPPIVIDSPVSNASFAGYVLTRLQRHRGGLRPYADGVIGINYLCARCSDDAKTTEIVKSRTFGVGLGGGVAIRWGNNPSNGDIFMLDLRLRYMHAPAADYLTNNLVVARVSTHMLQGYVGILIFCVQPGR